MFHTKFREAVIEELSGILTKNYISEISRYHRIQASPGFHAAIDYVKWEIDQFPIIKSEVESYVADGRTRMWEWTTPMGWQVTHGELRLVQPQKEVLARFSETPVSVVAHSQSADVKAPVVYVGEGLKDDDYQKVDVKGKIVLAYGGARFVHREAVVKRGALGVIHFPSLERRSRFPDLVNYDGIWPLSEEADKIGFGFSVSGRIGIRLRSLIEQKKNVVVQAKIDAELFEGEQRVLSAVIEGREYPNEEILLIAHLCHPRPGANDNASGSALLIEIARIISTLINNGGLPAPLRTIRFLWVPEFFGTIAYLKTHPEFAHRTLSGINCDMVGEDIEQCGGVLSLRRTPDSVPSYLNDLLEYHLEVAANEPKLISATGSRNPFHFEVKGFDWRSDHMMLNDATIRVPCLMLNHWTDNYYHSSEDTVDKCDTTQLKRVGFAVAMAVLTQAYAESDDAMFIATEVHARAHRRLTRTTQRIIHQAIGEASEAIKGPQITRILRKGMETLRRITERESAAIQSIQVLSRLDTKFQQLLDTMVDNLSKVRQDEIRKLRYVEDLLSTSIGYSPLKRLVLKKSEREAMTRILHRKFQGPLNFTKLLQSVKPEDAQWLRDQQKNTPCFVELLIELTNFADGHRNVYEILSILEAEFEELAEIGIVSRLVALLENLDLIESQITPSRIMKE